MRKVTYKIDVNKYLLDLAIRDNPTVDPEKIKAAIGTDDNWLALYTLYGLPGRFADWYSLTTYSGDRIDINSINGFQHSILNDCFANFTEPDKYPDPFCAIEITEEEMEEEREPSVRLQSNDSSK